MDTNNTKEDNANTKPEAEKVGGDDDERKEFRIGNFKARSFESTASLGATTTTTDEWAVVYADSNSSIVSSLESRSSTLSLFDASNEQFDQTDANATSATTSTTTTTTTTTTNVSADDELDEQSKTSDDKQQISDEDDDIDILEPPPMMKIPPSLASLTIDDIFVIMRARDREEKAKKEAEEKAKKEAEKAKKEAEAKAKKEAEKAKKEEEERRKRREERIRSGQELYELLCRMKEPDEKVGTADALPIDENHFSKEATPSGQGSTTKSPKLSAKGSFNDGDDNEASVLYHDADVASFDTLESLDSLSAIYGFDEVNMEKEVEEEEEEAKEKVEVEAAKVEKKEPEKQYSISDIIGQDNLAISSLISKNINTPLIRQRCLTTTLTTPPRNFFDIIKRLSPFTFASNTSSVKGRKRTMKHEVNASSCCRAYVHKRNVKLNGKLTMLLMLTLAVGIGIGIGHFVGWNNKHDQLSMVQVLKLKYLQEDLLACMHSEEFLDGGPLPLVCNENADYWRQRFEKLFEENTNLMELFRKTQIHFQRNGDHDKVIDEAECANKSTLDEFHKLHLKLLIKQLEHLKLLKKLEEVKEESQHQISTLQEENSDLKKKLIAEEADDQEIVEEWKNKYKLLEQENIDLRKSFVDDEFEDQQMIDGLKEEIALLSNENTELKTVLDQMYNDLVLSQIDKIRAKEEKTFDEFRMISFADIGLDPEMEPIEEDTLFRGKYRNLQKRVYKLYTENVELKEKMSYLQKLVKKLDDDNRRQAEADRLASRSESNFEKKMKAYSNQLQAVQRQLKYEKKETTLWRGKYDELRRKQRKESEKKKAAKEEAKRAEEERARDERAKEERAKHRQSSQTKEALRRLAVVTEDLLETFVAKMQMNWNEWNANGKANLEENLKRNKETAERYLKDVLKSVNKYSEKLVYKGIVGSEAIYNYFSDRFRDVGNIINNIQKSEMFDYGDDEDHGGEEGGQHHKKSRANAKAEL